MPIKNLAIIHHDIDVSIIPEKQLLRATDRIKLTGNSSSLPLYLGKRFTWTGVYQGDRSLQVQIEQEGKIAHRYRILERDSSGPDITATWEGTLDRFEGYSVNIIRPDLVELSGFCNWFPTIESQSQLERFTYDLRICLPNEWTIVTPGVEQKSDGGDRHYRYERPIEDIFICASPQFCCVSAKVGVNDTGLRMYLPPWPEEDAMALLGDFTQTVELCDHWFGAMRPGNGGVAVISPRGRDAAEWAYERDGLWVVGDVFARHLLDNQWTVRGLVKSLAAHETIHAWFGVGIRFTEPWLAEALTQYLEVIATAELFQEPELPKQYFRWYAERIEEQLAKEDRPVSDWSVTENMYVHWYLKGSWALWDLEAYIGRASVLKGVARVYEKFVGREVAYSDFVREMEAVTGCTLEAHFRHWFREEGFRPRYR